MNKSKLILTSVLLIGVIALIGSFHTIYINLLPTVGAYFAVTIPICLDIFVIVSTIYSILMIEYNKILQAKIVNYLSYIFMIGSLYFNIYQSINSLPALIGHSAIVVVWIASTEMLSSYYRIYYNSLEEREINKIKHENKIDLLKIEHENKKNLIVNALEINNQEIKDDKNIILDNILEQTEKKNNTHKKHSMSTEEILLS